MIASASRQAQNAEISTSSSMGLDDAIPGFLGFGRLAVTDRMQIPDLLKMRLKTDVNFDTRASLFCFETKW
jgi:hypothetical protein